MLTWLILLLQKDTFIKAVHSSSTQSFLEWFTETAMFHVFIQDRVQYDVRGMTFAWDLFYILMYG